MTTTSTAPPSGTPDGPGAPGIDVHALDPGTRPSDDLFGHVNGRWLASAQIPDDRATAGSFVDLRDAAEVAVRTIVERCRDSDAPLDTDEGKIGALYASFMDTEAVEAAGAGPVAAELADVDRVDDVAGLVRTLGRLESTGVRGFVGMWIAPDERDRDRYVVNLTQSGLGLPDESYYREDGFADVRTAYLAHLSRMLRLAGLDDTDARAERVLALETTLAAAHWDRVACRDAVATFNPTTYDALVAAAPALDWAAWLEASGVPRAAFDEVVVRQPSYLPALSELLDAEQLESWKDWLRYGVVASAAPYLSSDFVGANFDFYGRTLSGTTRLRDRWKRGVGLVEAAMGEAVGRLYVAEHYPPAARARMDDLIERLLQAYRGSIEELAWMGAETRARALDKLATFAPKVGHPERWRDYDDLVVERGDLWSNVQRVNAFGLAFELGRLGRPVDRDEWYMTPQTVNAYYNPGMNEIVFPAAILQPPFFSPDVDDAVNYGAIGAVIGHEIGHGFDDQGSQYDGDGRLENWWTDDDRAAFEERTGALIAQYDALEPADAPGHRVNGALTIGENIGDLGGLSIAYRAYRLSLDGAEPPEVDGFTGPQRFFLSWAQAWQSKVRPAEAVRRLTTDPHSPPEFRCNQVVRNIDAFYEAFDLIEGDPMYLPPEERVAIW